MAMYDLNYYEEMKKAEQGDLDAMFNVAFYIVWGDPASPVEPEAAALAVKYFKANAENGGTDSMLDLGAMYLEGRGVRKDEKEALLWYEKAAEHNGPRACRCIGNYYRKGIIVPQDSKKAFDLYSRAYEICEELEGEHFIMNDSYSDVCFRLAECCHYGIGTEINLEKALHFAQITKEETKKRLDSGDLYGGYLYPKALKEWQSIMAEAGF